MKRLKSLLRRRRSVSTLSKRSYSAKAMFNDCVRKIQQTNKAIENERSIVIGKVVKLEQQADDLSVQLKSNNAFLSKINSLLN